MKQACCLYLLNNYINTHNTTQHTRVMLITIQKYSNAEVTAKKQNLQYKDLQYKRFTVQS